jgi:hypothetical protein
LEAAVRRTADQASEERKKLQLDHQDAMQRYLLNFSVVLEEWIFSNFLSLDLHQGRCRACRSRRCGR